MAKSDKADKAADAVDPRTELEQLNAKIERQAAHNTITPDLVKRRDELQKQLGDFDKNPHAQEQ